MGYVMVESFLSAHRGQMPDAAYQKRVDEWTPEVSGSAWERALADGGGEAGAVLVAEDDDGGLVGLASGSAAEDDESGRIAEVGALYVLTARRGQGIGRSLLGAAASCFAEQGFTELQISVLTANLPARAFYEAVGGQEVGQGTTDEEGYLLPITIYSWPDLTTLTREDRRRHE
jgi:GNAT superfamily N-acetyltransferase